MTTITRKKKRRHEFKRIEKKKNHCTNRSTKKKRSKHYAGKPIFLFDKLCKSTVCNRMKLKNEMNIFGIYFK